MTYLTDLRSALTLAESRHIDATYWLMMGQDNTHSRALLEQTERHTRQALEQARIELATYLGCPRYASHRPLVFSCPPEARGIVQCYCPDCLDVGCIRGQGRTDDAALADYFEQIDL